MPCTELQQLRDEAKSLRQRVDEQRRIARAKSANPRDRLSGKSEMVPFLERKLQRVSDKIRLHMASHRCQD